MCYFYLCYFAHLLVHYLSIGPHVWKPQLIPFLSLLCPGFYQTKHRIGPKQNSNPIPTWTHFRIRQISDLEKSDGIRQHSDSITSLVKTVYSTPNPKLRLPRYNYWLCPQTRPSGVLQHIGRHISRHKMHSSTIAKLLCPTRYIIILFDWHYSVHNCETSQSLHIHMRSKQQANQTADRGTTFRQPRTARTPLQAITG